MAIVTTGQNIRFNTTLDDVVVLDETGDTRTIVMWDALSTNDQALLTTIINDLGGDAPMIAPRAGYADILYEPPITGSTPSGLWINDAPYPTIMATTYKGSLTEDSISGLDTSGPATHGFQDVVCWPVFIDESAASGLANDATIYTAIITVDGIVKNISVVGSSAQTIAALLDEINTDLEGMATASLTNVSATYFTCDIRITSATTGSTSTVSIVDETLFTSLTGWQEVSPAIVGRDSIGGTVKIYTAFFEIDNKLIRVEVNGNTGGTFSEVIDQIQTALGNTCSVVFSGSSFIAYPVAIFFITTSEGAQSNMRIYDTGWLFSSLTGFSGMYAFGDGGLINAGASRGSEAMQYTCVINVDGIDIPISCTVVWEDPTQTIAPVLADINAKLGGAATAAIVDGKIRITSATTGSGSSVKIKDDTVFNRINGYTGVRSIPGASNLVDAFKVIQIPNGVLAGNYFPHKTVGIRPPDPLRGVTIPKTIKYIYWGGTPADWRYFNDDSAV